MDDDFDIDDNPEWDETNSRPLDTAAKLIFVRAFLSTTQSAFADLIGIPVATLQNWEQRRTEPDPAARALIDLMVDDPEGMSERLRKRQAA